MMKKIKRQTKALLKNLKELKEEYKKDIEKALDTDAIVLGKLSKDVVNAAKLLTPEQARYLVDRYYQVQKDRIRAEHQVRMAKEAREPNVLVDWTAKLSRTVENAIKKALDIYTDEQLAGRWAKSIYGVGPVLTAGLLAHIDITKAPHVGHIYSFAGITGKEEWKKGEKRPWNARLKTLCYKIGLSFIYFSTKPECYYGKLYAEQRKKEDRYNGEGKYREFAAQILEKKKYDHETVAYKHYIVGTLPPAHLNAKARRWAVKMFLSHFHQVLYFQHYKKFPAMPYAIDILGHKDYIEPPNLSEFVKVKPKSAN